LHFRKITSDKSLMWPQNDSAVTEHCLYSGTGSWWHTQCSQGWQIQLIQGGMTAVPELQGVLFDILYVEVPSISNNNAGEWTQAQSRRRRRNLKLWRCCTLLYKYS